MAYEAEMITYSQKIFYYLLCHGALSDLDAGVNDLYRAYVEHEEVMNLVKNQAEIADCKIERYGTTIYLMPDIDNKYLGFTKADLKKELCKPNATDRDYYLAQFVILTLLVEFYDGQGSTSKSREFLKLGELQNLVLHHVVQLRRRLDHLIFRNKNDQPLSVKEVADNAHITFLRILGPASRLHTF